MTISKLTGNIQPLDEVDKINEIIDGIPPVVGTVTSSSTNASAVGAKLFYDTCGDIETLINAL